MQSKTLSSKGLFSPALFRNNLSRFWPLWMLYLAVWLLAMPAVQFLQLFGHNRHWMEEGELCFDALGGVLAMSESGGTIIALIFGVLFAMALFSYLVSARSVSYAHALPVKREGLFLTHYFTGVGVFLMVHALAAVLTAAIWAVAGVQQVWIIGVWFLSTTGQMLFFYSFAVFCAMFAGQLLAIPAFYGIFNVLVLGVRELISMLCEMFIYGWNGMNESAAVTWLTPAYKLASQLGDIWARDAQGYRTGIVSEEIQRSLGVVSVYALAGVVLAVCALLVYQRRRSETAGDVVAIGWARPIFRYGVGMCCALSFGQLMYAILWSSFGGSENSVVALAVCMILVGLVGYFGAEMLLQKSFRILKKGWKGGVILSAALIVLCIGFSVDLLGIEKRVPAAADVETLDFGIYSASSVNGSTADPEMIQRFLSIHQSLADQQPKYNWQDEDTESITVRLRYMLKNGKTLSRYYSLTYQKQGPNEEVLTQLALLASDAAVRRADLENQMLNRLDRLTSAEIQLYQTADMRGQTMSFDADTAQTLLDALEADIDAGHAGMDAMDSARWYENTYTNRLTFYYRVKTTPDSHRRDESDSFYLEFSKNYTNLIAALEAAGVDTDMLVTYQENDAISDGSMPAKSAYEFAQEGIGGAYETPDFGTSVAIIGGADGSTQVIVADEPVPADTAVGG